MRAAGRGRLKLWAAFIGSGLVLAIGASPATASVSIGQLASAPTSLCNITGDRIQPTVTFGNTYVVPEDGTITSWSYSAAGGAGQSMTMTVFRKVTDPAIYMVVGHDGPRGMTENTVNTFPASVPVKAGDVLGTDQPAGPATACVFPAPGESFLFNSAHLADGESGAFASGASGSRLNVSAVVAPTNAFSIGETIRNKKKGTATITVNVPNPGELTGSGNGAKVASSTTEAVTSKSIPAGPSQLLVKAKGKKRKKLKETGKVKLSVAVTYTPAGGDPNTQSVKVSLKKL